MNGPGDFDDRPPYDVLIAQRDHLRREVKRLLAAGKRAGDNFCRTVADYENQLDALRAERVDADGYAFTEVG